MSIQALRGTHDILPIESFLWFRVEETARTLFNLFDFQEIRTPILEEAALFIHTSGEGSDIVEKEMYAFMDKGERQICLRPEGTAGVVRAYLEHGLGMQKEVVKLFYLGAMFRAERPQAGRQRQFHQIGIETIGSASPWTDVENLHLLCQLLSKLSVEKFTLHLNHLGCKEDRPLIIEELSKVLSPILLELCENCQVRFQKNRLRILDCKKSSCREKTLSNAGNIFQLICEKCDRHFQQVQEGLKILGISYQRNPYLVRGLDYYTGTVFEVSVEKLGSQDTLVAGGRYDRLIEDLGGKAVPATGWALGVERLLMILPKQDAPDSPCIVYVAVTSEFLKGEGFKILSQLREAKISAMMDFEEKSLKGQLRTANKIGSLYVLLMGDEEWKRGEVILKNMQAGTQEIIHKQEVVDVIQHKVKN